MLVLALIIVATGFGASLVGTATAVRHRAEAAADLAALAAASVAPQGEEVACASAKRIAAANSAQIRLCSVRAQVSEVIVQVRAWGPLSGLPPIAARARAGPVEPDLFGR